MQKKTSTGMKTAVLSPPIGQFVLRVRFIYPSATYCKNDLTLNPSTSSKKKTWVRFSRCSIAPRFTGGHERPSPKASDTRRNKMHPCQMYQYYCLGAKVATSVSPASGGEKNVHDVLLDASRTIPTLVLPYRKCVRHQTRTKTSTLSPSLVRQKCHNNLVPDNPCLADRRNPVAYAALSVVYSVPVSEKLPQKKPGSAVIHCTLSTCLIKPNYALLRRHDTRGQNLHNTLQPNTTL